VHLRRDDIRSAARARWRIFPRHLLNQTPRGGRPLYCVRRSRRDWAGVVGGRDCLPPPTHLACPYLPPSYSSLGIAMHWHFRA